MKTLEANCWLALDIWPMYFSTARSDEVTDLDSRLTASGLLAQV
jgi:hypothetical protein